MIGCDHSLGRNVVMTLKLGDESEPEVVDLSPVAQLCPFLFSVAI